MQEQQPQKQCLNCRRSFQQGQTLPPEGIHIEYKKYYLPIKDHQPKWILLKTIVAFLNSKGGTIFMGVDDSTREVVGLPAELKEQDVFMLDFAQLLDSIQPQIDLRHKEEVKVRFVPVLKDKTFQGKYVIKIVVKQGHPSKVYHFAQTLKFINEDHKHHDEEFKVLWGFYRSNMGKVDAIKGTQLMRQVYQKAKNPSIIVQTFHEGCNPEPLQVSVRNMNIGFKSLKNPELKANILDFIQRKLKVLNLQTSYSILQTQQDDTVILKFKSITEYKTANCCIKDHEKEISSLIEGKDTLIDEGCIDNTHFYKVGQEFNPSLRYMRNREKSRERSIDIDNEVSPHHKDETADGSLHPSKSQHQTRFKPKKVEPEHLLKPQNHFVKLKPEDQDPSDDEQAEQHHPQSLSPQQHKKSPAKKFELKTHQFPALQKSNLQPQDKGEKKALDTKINVLPPSIISQRNQSDQKCTIKFSNIYQKAYSRLVNYLQSSLSKQMDKIPHKVQENLKTQQVIIHFNSLKDIELFVADLTQNTHNRQVLNGFGDGRIIKITVKKGGRIEDMRWPDQKENKGQKHQQIQVNQHDNNQSPKKTVTLSPQHDLSKSPNNKGISPAKSIKMKFAQIKGFPFVISNLRTDLSQVQKGHLSELLKLIFKTFCTKDAKVQIGNQKSYFGIIDLNFQTVQERKHFADLMQTDVVKYHEFTHYFKGYRAFWGVPTGNIIVHHYKAEEKKQFKEQVDKLFSEENHSKLISSKYIKEEDKFFLRLSFHSNHLVEAMEQLLYKINESPLKEFSSSKDGIVVMPELSRI